MSRMGTDGSAHLDADRQRAEFLITHFERPGSPVRTPDRGRAHPHRRQVDPFARCDREGQVIAVARVHAGPGYIDQIHAAALPYVTGVPDPPADLEDLVAGDDGVKRGADSKKITVVDMSPAPSSSTS